MKSLRKIFYIVALSGFALVLSGCASTPKFDCDSARERIIEEDKKVKKAAADFHAAEAQKDAGYYGIKGVRTITCIGTLGLLCGLADTIASENTRTEERSEDYKKEYEESVKLSEGLRKAMHKNRCPKIPIKL